MFFTVFSPNFRDGCGSEQVSLGASDLKSRSTNQVERFLFILRLENKEKFGELSDVDLISFF